MIAVESRIVKKSSEKVSFNPNFNLEVQSILGLMALPNFLNISTYSFYYSFTSSLSFSSLSITWSPISSLLARIEVSMMQGRAEAENCALGDG